MTNPDVIALGHGLETYSGFYDAGGTITSPNNLPKLEEVELNSGDFYIQVNNLEDIVFSIDFDRPANSFWIHTKIAVKDRLSVLPIQPRTTQIFGFYSSDNKLIFSFVQDTIGQVFNDIDGYRLVNNLHGGDLDVPLPQDSDTFTVTPVELDIKFAHNNIQVYIDGVKVSETNDFKITHEVTRCDFGQLDGQYIVPMRHFSVSINDLIGYDVGTTFPTFTSDKVKDWLGPEVPEFEIYSLNTDYPFTSIYTPQKDGDIITFKFPQLTGVKSSINYSQLNLIVSGSNILANETLTAARSRLYNVTEISEPVVVTESGNHNIKLKTEVPMDLTTEVDTYNFGIIYDSDF